MICMILFLLLPLTVIGDRFSCASACQESLDGLTFNGTDPNVEYYTAYCNSILRAQSTYVCSRYYCSPGDLIAGLDYLNKSCQKYGSTSLPPYSIILNVTDIEKLRIIGIDDAHLAETIGTIVFPSRDLFEIALRTIVSADNGRTDWDR
jgi:hypothetical protein